MGPQVVKKNPNAAVGATTGALAIAVAWVATNGLHVQLSAEDGAAVATLLSTGALFLGHHGIRGIARMIWRGSDAVTDAPVTDG
jgi:hypothetical protein